MNFCGSSIGGGGGGGGFLMSVLVTILSFRRK